MQPSDSVLIVTSVSCFFVVTSVLTPHCSLCIHLVSNGFRMSISGPTSMPSHFKLI